MRSLRLAEMVAASLREGIVNGEINDGSELPSVEVLSREFEVSPSPVREALRILESEGLITVRRGRTGGAVVHSPRAAAAGYMLGIVLQSERVEVDDVGKAMVEMVASCASVCARRTDRKREVLPVLHEVHDRAVAAIDRDAVVFEREARAFHEALMSCSGNSTLALLASTVQWLWSSQERAWAFQIHAANKSPTLALRKAGLRDHVKIIDAIRAGDHESAAETVRRHSRQPDIGSDDAALSQTVAATQLSPSLMPARLRTVNASEANPRSGR